MQSVVFIAFMYGVESAQYQTTALNKIQFVILKRITMIPNLILFSIRQQFGYKQFINFYFGCGVGDPIIYIHARVRVLTCVHIQIVVLYNKQLQIHYHLG